MSYLKELMSSFEKDPNHKIEPCSNQELFTLQKHLNRPLPLAYIEFLESMGKYAYFLREDHCFINDLKRLNVTSRLFLQKYNKRYEKNLGLSEEDFVFWKENNTEVLGFNQQANKVDDVLPF